MDQGQKQFPHASLIHLKSCLSTHLPNPKLSKDRIKKTITAMKDLDDILKTGFSWGFCEFMKRRRKNQHENRRMRGNHRFWHDGHQKDWPDQWEVKPDPVFPKPDRKISGKPGWGQTLSANSFPSGKSKVPLSLNRSIHPAKPSSL